ncbi:hypothetical protein E2C01_023590 [Portunus trituberculatus]|uniref:Uncharacterized protein n=1 Tax=Portunus trituberculatus TaxID=210409 RepID=A0A5B7EA97_PORTR|nr:hypothetical protein [Portunus trituberculatus]
MKPLHSHADFYLAFKIVSRALRVSFLNLGCSPITSHWYSPEVAFVTLCSTTSRPVDTQHWREDVEAWLIGGRERRTLLQGPREGKGSYGSWGTVS